MTEAEVRSLMGKPNEWKWANADSAVSTQVRKSLNLSGKEVWLWSFCCKDPLDFSSNKSCYTIVFDKPEGKVLETYLELPTID
jgi:hypothetical protein